MATYENFHQNKKNLLIHILTVPVFILGNLSMAIALFQGELLLAVLSFGVAMAGLGIQAKSHRLEPNKVAPFLGALDFFKRIYTEQFITFPTYLISPEFRSHWKNS